MGIFHDSNTHHLNSHRHLTLPKKDLPGTIQNHSTHFKLLYSKIIKQVICTCHSYHLSAFKKLIDQLYCSIAFSSTQNQCWIITVIQIFKHDYSRTVYYSTEKIQPDLCQYSFRFQSHLHPNKNNNTTQCLQTKTMYSDMYAQTHVQTAKQSQTKQILFFLPYIFFV